MIILTKSAIEEVKRLALKLDYTNYWIRFGVIGGGCVGFAYYFQWMPPLIAMMNTDHLLEQDGVNVYVDHKSYLYLDGTEIDFVTGINGHGFKFNNPNVETGCSCGESVSFK